MKRKGEPFDIYKLAHKHAKAAGFRDKNGKPLLRPKGPGDWSLPGYNYIGPGNPTGDGYLPVDDDDMGASDHDGDYGDIQGAGQNPYVRYSKADEKARNSFGKRAHGYGGKLGKAYFTGKKWVTPGVDEDAVDSYKKHKAEQKVQKTMQSEGINSHGAAIGSLNNLPGSKMVSGAQGAKRKRDDDGGDGGTGGTAPTPQPAQPAGTGTSPAGLRVGASMGGAANGTKGHGETPLDPWSDVALRPFPETRNAILPYYAQGTISLGATQTESGVSSFTLRLNSIYDCQTSRTYSENPTPAADTADATINTPIMRDFYAQIYKYWSVVGSQVRVRFWTEDQPAASQELDIFCYKHGQQSPPFVNSTGITGGILWKKYRLMHPRCEHKSMRVRDSTNTEIGDFDRTCEFDVEYDPNNDINEVEEDDYAQTWHKMTEVPPLHEQCTFIVQRSERSPFAALAVKYDIQMVFKVQYKDTKANLRYPYPAADITFTDYAAQVN